MPALVRAHNKHVRPSACRDIDDESSSDKGGVSSVVVCASSLAAGAALSSGVCSSSQTVCSSSSNAITKISSSKKTTNVVSASSKWQETFHFASFLPINGHLYEMDSLKPYPIDHGPVPDGLEWHHHFLQLLYDRIVTDNEGESHEIRYNLMALVPRRLDKLREKVALLSSNRTHLILAIKMLVMAIDPDIYRRELHMTSFCSRTKLSDADILTAAECIERPKDNFLNQNKGSISELSRFVINCFSVIAITASPACL
uniref:ubiquitinyl hydrolase 1 n=1 Tax=Romanomermis culicivorax TaxID=13658 RepID=A0A915J871_ROMCU